MARSPAVIPGRRSLIALACFAALSALGGGTLLVTAPPGLSWGPPSSLLEHTPFTGFVAPGLMLGLVVGGTSVAAALLLWRRSRLAIDAVLLAGGAMTVWIVAEAAIFRAVHWLHLVYGATGLAMLALAVHAGLRSGLVRHRWLILVTAGEALGFCAPITAGVLAARGGLGTPSRLSLLIAAGALEGLALGTAQALAMPVRVRRRPYALLTAAAAALVWTLALVAPPLAQRAPTWLGVSLAIVVAPVALAAIGAAQWLELRHRLPSAHAWIAWTALAWALALPLSFAPSPFVDETTPLAPQLALWAVGGLLMAFTMALCTWQGVRGLVHRRAPSVPARAGRPAPPLGQQTPVAAGP